MGGVNSAVSTLKVPSTVTVVRVTFWRVITAHVKVKKGIIRPLQTEEILMHACTVA